MRLVFFTRLACLSVYNHHRRSGAQTWALSLFVWGVLNHPPQWLTLRTSGCPPRRVGRIAHGSVFAPCLGWSIHHAAAAPPVPHLAATHLERSRTHRFSRTYPTYGAAAGWTLRDVVYFPNWKATSTPAVSQLTPTPHQRQ